MAEVIAFGASVIAIVQVADRIIGACKSYISSVRDAPSDLRAILVEISALKTVLENLTFLNSCDTPCSPMFNNLCGTDGPIEACLLSVNELAGLFPPDETDIQGQGQSKRRKIKSTMVALAWPLKETKARKLLDDILRYKSTITLALTTDTFQDIKETKVKAVEIHDMMTENQREEVYRWLHHTDPSPNHHRAQKNYESETGDWMLRSHEWTDWLKSKSRCLWIHGIPGAGKTILMSHLIEQIKEICDESSKRDIAYVFYYCYFAHNQDETKPFLKWLIGQLCRKADHVPAVIDELRKRGGEPNIADLLDALASILTRFETVYVAVDAIDESDPRDDLLMVFQDLVTESRFKQLQVIASSREYIDIERIMAEISVPVSMNNPYVEMDIRRHVQSFLQSCDKFKKWPLELLNEVEEAVTKGARGMFRWAVCQLDALKRLKSERHIVMKALQNLPKTLYETYDRIFSLIPMEERIIAHHVLRWIAHHTETFIFADAMPFEVLIQAAVASTVALTGEPNERLYDLDTLREICGCLIEISPREYPQGDSETYSSVSFAHYTVLEYLESGRIPESISAYHGAGEKTPRDHFIQITMSKAQDVNPEESLATKSEIEAIKTFYSDFTNYCMALSIASLYQWSDHICRQSVLSRLAVDFLNPSKPHLEYALTMASVTHENTELVDQDIEGSRVAIWDMDWSPAVGTDAKHLYFLLCLCNCREVYTPLVKNFLQENDHEHLLQSQLKFRKYDSIYDSYRRTMGDEFLFSGSILEVFAQYRGSERIISLLMDIGAGLFDPSVILLLVVIGRGNSALHDGASPLIQRLLKLGADPNLTNYMVTPLQIATYHLNFEEASILLEHGAHPSSTGCSDGAVWEKHTIMSYFNHLHGASPLRILKKYTYISPVLKRYEGIELVPEARKKLEELLLQYGAEEISSTPEAALEEVKYDTPGWKKWAMASPQTRSRTISKLDDSSADPSEGTSTSTESSPSSSTKSAETDALPAFLTKILN